MPRTERPHADIAVQGWAEVTGMVNTPPWSIHPIRRSNRKVGCSETSVRATAARLGKAPAFAPESLFHGDPDVVSLRSLVLFGMRGIAAYAWHAHVLGVTDPMVSAFL